MKQKRLWTLLLALALAAVFTVGGCAKKQIETDVVPQGDEKPEVKPPPPVRPEPPKPPVDRPVGVIKEPPVKPPPPPPRPPVRRPEPPIDTAGLEPIHFDFDEYVIRRDQRRIMQQNAAYLLGNPGVFIRIEGHCDERGTIDYNLALGERRAQSARQYLVDLEVDAGRISVISYGEERPADPGHNEAAWAKNRRAKLVKR